MTSVLSGTHLEAAGRAAPERVTWSSRLHSSDGRGTSLDTRSSLFDLDDENQLHRLSEWVGQWEPCLSIGRPQRDAVLYEPEGTLYAIAVGTTMIINLFHRERTVRKGDAIVVPQGLAIEINPEVDLLAIRSTGTPPGHFRERFIQVWGYEHFSADHALSEADTRELHEVIRESDPRFPLSYAIWQPQQTRAGPSFRTCENELVLLLNLNRQAVRVEIDCEPAGAGDSSRSRDWPASRSGTPGVGAWKPGPDPNCVGARVRGARLPEANKPGRVIRPVARW